MGSSMRTRLRSVALVLALLILPCAFFLTYLAIGEFFNKLVNTGCVAALFGGPASPSPCGSATLSTGVYFIFAAMAWWAMWAVLVVPVERPWKPLATLAMLAGAMTGAAVSLLYVLPVFVVFVLYVLYPIALFVVSGIAFLGAWVLGHVWRIFGV